MNDAGTSHLDRALAALYGLALGDALGMPSQTLKVEEIRHHYGIISDFVAPFDDHPVSHGLKAGEVTDDTEQALLLARRLIADPGGFDATGWAHDLLDWEKDVKRRGLRDILGPSSKAALDALASGADADIVARNGTTNGAAMRITPLGVATPCDDLPLLVASVAATCRVTHNTGEAIAGAAAVAAAISARIEGYDAKESLACALKAAQLGQKCGHTTGVRDMADRIANAVALADQSVSPDTLASIVGTSVASRESVPVAFGLERLAQGDVWHTAEMAANIGDDTDTIGAIATALCGAATGMAGFPCDKLDTLKRANTLDIDTIAPSLLELRRSRLAPVTRKVAQ